MAHAPPARRPTPYLSGRRAFARNAEPRGAGQARRAATRLTRAGRREFNQRAKYNGLEPAGEIVTVQVPPLVDRATFDPAHAHLRARNPKVKLARVASGPTLLTGIRFRADYGGSTRLRAGKRGRYRDYTCSAKARRGETGCKGRPIPM